VLKMAQKFKSWASAVSHKQCGHIWGSYTNS
jgi:hypothetical protein